MNLRDVTGVASLRAVEERRLVEVIERRGDLMAIVSGPAVGAVRAPPLDHATPRRLHLLRRGHDGGGELLDVHLAPFPFAIVVRRDKVAKVGVGRVDVDAEERLAKVGVRQRPVVVRVEKPKQPLGVFPGRVAAVGVLQVMEHRRLDPTHGQVMIPAPRLVPVEAGDVVRAGPSGGFSGAIGLRGEHGVHPGVSRRLDPRARLPPLRDHGGARGFRAGGPAPARGRARGAHEHAVVGAERMRALGREASRVAGIAVAASPDEIARAVGVPRVLLPVLTRGDGRVVTGHEKLDKLGVVQVSVAVGVVLCEELIDQSRVRRVDVESKHRLAELRGVERVPHGDAAARDGHT